MCICLAAKIFSAPVANIQYTCNENTLLKFAVGSEYTYDYSTSTELWINDVSEESKSRIELKATVVLRAVDKCLYMLRIPEATLTGETVSATASAAAVADLTNNAVQFRMNSDGELDPTLEFVDSDKPWSRNIKRGILSAFQLKSVKELRTLDGEAKRSAVVYETDVLGRCRTTYSTEDKPESAEINLKKKKSLNRCTLDENTKSSAIQYIPYKNLPEFKQGKLFIESYECESKVTNGIIEEIECDETSVYKIGSRGTKGIQAIVSQTLKLTNSRVGHDKMNYGPFSEKFGITFEYTDRSVDDSEYKSLDVNKFLADVCERTSGKEGLDVEHANNFRALVNKLDSYTEAQLLKLYEDSKKKCEIAGITASNAIIFTNTDASVAAILKLLEKDELSSQRYITEYPILTALARHQEVSLELLGKIKTFIQARANDFPYLKKLYLIYSSLIKTHCLHNTCNDKTLEGLSGFIAANLGTDCSDSTRKDLVTVSLKAIGNVGHVKNNGVLVKCAQNKKNSMEVRVSALQAFRRMACEETTAQEGIGAILRDADEDAELRITAFQTLARCSHLDSFKEVAKNVIPEFLEAEKDPQVLTYIIDYAKEHGITAILNPILNNPRLKEKFSVNFKQLSWNNYHYKYSILRDGAVEIDTSVIFDTKKAFVPRSVRVNATIHMYGMSINFLDLTVRMEGLDEILRSALIEKLRSGDLLRRISEKPETLIKVLSDLADKLTYKMEKPYISILARIYGSDVFYSEIDNLEKFKRLAEFIRAPRDKLVYSDIDTIRNMLLIESRVRQRLLNGFELNTFMDLSASLFISKESKKTDSGDKREFQVNNFYSKSLAINKRFEVRINKENRIALKKKSVLNTAFNVNVEGTKTNNTHVYNINLRPKKDLKLVSFSGKFFKLGANSEFKEVTKFTVEQRQKELCTSDNFKSSVGVQLCLSVRRPKIGSLKNLIWPEANPIETMDEDDDDDDDDKNDDDDDDDDEEENIDKNITRPRMTLSGPYSYELTLKNPDLVKALIVKGKVEKSERKIAYNAKLQTKSATNQVQDRLELNYARQRNYTNLMVDRSISLELKRSKTNEVRLKFLAKVAFVKKQLIHLNLNVQNKILRELDANLEFKREKTPENVAPVYKIEAMLDSKLRGADKRRYAKFSANLKPNGRNINGDIVVERLFDTQVKKIADAKLALKSNKEGAVDYDVELLVNTMVPSKSRLYGKVAASMLESSIDLNLVHDGQRLDLVEPANLKLGHSVDASGVVAKTELFAHLKADLPTKKINHGGKVLLEANPNTMRPTYLEVQVNTVKTALENNNLPYTVFLGKRVSNAGETKKTVEYLAGIKNFNIDLSARAESGLGRTLVKVDNNNIMKSLTLVYRRIEDQSDKSVSTLINVKKNEANLANIQTGIQGSMKDIRENAEEIPKQTMGVLFNAKVLDYAGLLDCKMTMESSLKNAKHAFTLDVKTDSFVKILLKVSSIKSKLMVNGATNKIQGEFEIQKMGEVKSWKLKTSSGELKKVGDRREFDVDYEKNLANGQKLTGSGAVQYVWDDAKNWEAKLDIKNKFNFKISAENERESNEALLGSHDILINYAHLDGTPEEREFKVQISNKTDNKLTKIVVNLSAKKGAPGKLDDKNTLHYLFDLATDNTMLNLGAGNGSTLLEGKNELSTKLKQFNIDLNVKNTVKLDLRAKTFALNLDTKVKFPAIVSDPGKMNMFEETIAYNINLANNRRTLKAFVKSDNKLIGKYFKELSVDYSRDIKTVGVHNNNHLININADLTTTDDQKKNLKASIERFSCKEDSNDVCQGTKIDLKQNIVPLYKRKLKEGTIDITDCDLNTKLVRVKSESKYELSLLTHLNCADQDIVNNKLRVLRDRQNKETQIQIGIGSDILYPKRSFEFAHKKFNKKNGRLELSIQSPDVEHSTKFSYERQLDEVSGKLTKGNYKLDTSFGSAVTKSCEMNIESKDNYYNKFSCSVKTSKLPTVTYGYSVKVNDQKELLFGKRDIVIDLNLPSNRVLRVQYVASHAVQANAIDLADDDDSDEEDNDREFNATLTYYWDQSRQPSKFVKIDAKRDNYAKGCTKLTVNFLNYPKLKLLKLEVDRQRSFNQTEIGVSVSYEVEGGKKNRLDIDSVLNSDTDSVGFSIETNLEKPKFNIYYTNRFDRYNGRLQYLEVRLAKLIRLRIDKEADPDNRRISVELADAGEGFSVEDKRTDKAGIYTVESQLKQGARALSKLESRFDSNNNVLNVLLNNKYQLNLGVYSERLADLSITNTQDKKKLALGTLRVYEEDEVDYLELKLKWDRFWSAMQKDILNNQDQADRAKPNQNYNSYLGDVLAQLSQDLKPAYDGMAEERAPVKKDLAQFGMVLAQFYSNYIPKKQREDLKALLEKKIKERQEADEEINAMPFHKRVYHRYNRVAEALNKIYLRLRLKSRRLARYVPKLPIIKYSSTDETNQGFDNNVVITRTTRHAKTLYQANAIYRDGIRKLAERFLTVKGNLARNTKAYSFRSLINKYKYRPLDSYTMVGAVFNRRAVMRFNGNARFIQSPCQVLLTHDLARNKFSVILNDNKREGFLTVHAYGQPPIEINAESAFIDGKRIALPYKYENKEKSDELVIKKTINGVSLELIDELLVECYADSKLCVVGLTRFSIGKVNGLLGRSSYDSDDSAESAWFVDKSCKAQTLQLKTPSSEAVRTCYKIFGQQRKSYFKDAFGVVRPNGWQKVCETALNMDIKNKCPLMKSFAQFVRIKRVDVDEPNECYQCKANDKTYNIGQNIENAPNAFEKSSDFVFVLLPCDYSRNFLELVNNLQKVNVQQGANRYYFVQASQHGATLYQDEKGKTHNFDIKKAVQSLSETRTTSTHLAKEDLYRALFLAGGLFSNRLAQNRNMIIVSCGNCVDYKMLATLKLHRLLRARNIVVSSWGLYDMRDTDASLDETETAIGYAHGKIFLKKDGKVEVDSAAGYRVEHNLDLCARMAMKTKGGVFNVSELKSASIFEQTVSKLREIRPNYDNQLERCERISTPFGDVADFHYKRVLKPDEDNENDDDDDNDDVHDDEDDDN